MSIETATAKLDETIEALKQTQEQVDQIIEMRAAAVERADRAEKEVQRLHRVMAERQGDGLSREDSERLARALADEIHHTATGVVKNLLWKLVHTSYAEEALVDAWRQLENHTDWRDLVWRAIECAELDDETSR